MNDDDLRDISNKLSLLIKITLTKDENFKKMKASERISLVNYKELTTEQISYLLDIPIKTVRNILPHLNK